MEINANILQRSVEVAKFLLQISIWLVYIVSQIFILFVMMRGIFGPPIRYPPPPPPLPFEKFNGDIILEVFRYYVSSQPDGAFILTLVSTSWRDFVLRSPALWQWITIDEQSPDWIEKAYLSATLSGACPLQVVLRLPIKECDPLVPLLSRCQNIFFEIPDYMTGRDVDQGTEKLLSAFKTPHGCAFHYLRAGEYLLQEARKQISIDLSNVLRLDFVADGSKHPNYHEYAKTRHVRYLERGDDYHPLVLLKLYCLLDILRNASNLRTLILSHHSMDPIFSEFDLPFATLSNLEELRVTGIDYNRNGSLVPLSQSIRCLNLSNLVLCGVYVDVMDVLEHLSRVSQPVNLELRYDTHMPHDAPIAAPFHIPSVTHLLLQVHQERFRAPIPEVARSLNAAIRVANRATVLKILLEGCEGHWNPRNDVIKCVRHHPFSEEKCDLRYNRRAMLELELTETEIKEIDIKLISPYLDSNLRRPGTAIVTRSQFLTTVGCTPYVLLPLLSQHTLPMLNTIRLHIPEENGDTLGELTHFDRKVTRWITRHVVVHLPLKVHTFGLSWFPNWRTLLPMLYYMSKTLRDGLDLTIKLPACPHPVIHQALILALEGKDHGANSIPSVPLDGKVSSGVKGKSQLPSFVLSNKLSQLLPGERMNPSLYRQSRLNATTAGPAAYNVTQILLGEDFFHIATVTRSRTLSASQGTRWPTSAMRSRVVRTA